MLKKIGLRRKTKFGLKLCSYCGHSTPGLFFLVTARDYKDKENYLLLWCLQPLWRMFKSYYQKNRREYLKTGNGICESILRKTAHWEGRTVLESGGRWLWVNKMGPFYCELMGSISGSWENLSLYSPSKMGLLTLFLKQIFETKSKKHETNLKSVM